MQFVRTGHRSRRGSRSSGIRRRHPEEQSDAVRQNRASLPQRFSEQKLRTMNDLVQHYAPRRAKRVPSAQECSRALRSKHVHVFRLELQGCVPRTSTEAFL